MTKLNKTHFANLSSVHILGNKDRYCRIQIF